MNNFALDPQTHEDQVSHKIVFALERLSHVFRIKQWEINKRLQLSPLQMQILTILRFQPRLDTLTAVSRYLHLSKATVSDAVRVLTNKAYVQKEPNTEDGRSYHLTLTAAGTAAAEEFSLFANELGEFVAALPKQTVFLESLLQLMGRLQENDFIPTQQMCTTCGHFRYTEPGIPSYFCQFLDKPLSPHELRVHCPEYESA